MQVFDLMDVVELSKHRCNHPIEAELKHITSKNAVGQITHGFTPDLAHAALLRQETAEKLCEIQNYLNNTYGYGLLIHKAYQPKVAITHFLRNFGLSYAAAESGYCYGNSVDLILKDIKTNRKLCIGTCFDVTGELFHTSMGEKEMSQEAFHHRKVLSNTMQQFGFTAEAQECWHFSYQQKKCRPLDIPITPEVVEKVKKLSL